MSFYKPVRWRGRLLRLLVLPLAVLAACSPVRLLRPGQRLLYRIELRGVEQADEERLLALAQQKPNTKFPPKLAIYQLGLNFYDSVRIQKKLEAIRAGYAQRMQAAGSDSVKLGKLLVDRERRVKRKQLDLDKGNAIMRLGEAPVVYNPALTERTAEQMTTFLRSQGFFRASVRFSDTTRTKRGLWRGTLYGLGLRKQQPRLDSTGAVRLHRRVTVTYFITENRPFVFTELTSSIPDSGVAAAVRRGQGQTLLKIGARYNEELIGQERSRLEALAKNAGYYDFRQQYITLEADTSFAPYTVRLRTLVANPAPDQGHRRYTLRRVRMVTDAGTNRTLRASTGDTLRRAGVPGQPDRPRLGIRTDTTETDSVSFAAFQQKFSTRLLARKITIRPGQGYSLLRTVQTQRLLADLDMFRFNTVSYRKVPDPTDTDSAGVRPAAGQLDAVITASPAEKFVETTEFGGTFVANLPGPFVNVRLKTRNPFGGAEVLELGVRLGYEGQFNRVGGVDGTGENQYTTLFGATAALVVPRFLVPFGTSRFLSRYNPRTRFSLSDTYVNRPEYTRTNLEFTYDYIWQKSTFHQYVLSPVVLNLVNTTDVSDAFQARLNDLRALGSPLYRSFGQLFVPSMSFTSLYNSNDFNQTRDARYLRLFAEVGGFSRGLYQNLPWFGLEVYNFAKFNVDFRRYHHLTPRTYFVWRLNGGVAHALSRTDVKIGEDNGTDVFQRQLVIPYDKYFFAGGSNSVRAWQPRRLGPGGYTTYTPLRDAKNQIVLDPNNQPIPVRDFRSEQPGELLLEGSVEYRFPVYSFIKGAVFTDFGNVWTLQVERNTKNEPLRPDAQFDLSTFYRQFAVGSGAGVRFDFTFLILRLDVAAKVYDPTAPTGEEWAIKRLYKAREYSPTFNLGIGYPF